jgi:hypothetical protein
MIQAIAEDVRRICKILEDRLPLQTVLPIRPEDPPYRIVWAEPPTFPTLP